MALLIAAVRDANDCDLLNCVLLLVLRDTEEARNVSVYTRRD